MEKKFMRILSLVLTTCLMFSMLSPITTTAAGESPPNYEVSSSYRSSPYYTALHNVILTGNQREDIVNVALSQVNYKEGSFSNDFGGADDGPYNNYTEYNYWYNRYVSSHMPVGGSNAPWCATFVSWCADQANVPSTVLKRSTIAGHGASYFNVNFYSGSGTLHSSADNDRYFKGYNYTPQKGDLFFTRTWSHVGLVADIVGDRVITVEGNTNTTGSSQGDGVYRLSYRRIADLYFGVPNYTSDPIGEHTTCNKGEYVYYEAVHPHYKCYRCSVCGEIWRDTSEPTMVATCTTCYPPKTVDERFSPYMPAGVYPLSTGRINVYDAAGNVYDNRYIDGATDICVIWEIYTDGWCKVRYPSTAEESGHFDAYVPLSTFTATTNQFVWIAEADYNTYKRADLQESMLTISSGMNCLVLDSRGSLRQVLHPVSGQEYHLMDWINYEHTCNRGEYVFFEEAHPHYSCYQCSICGEIWADTTSSNYSDSCYSCNHLEKPILTTSSSTYTIGDNITISWNAINGNEYYWINVYRDDALIVDQTMEQRTSYTLENAQPGSYRILVSANNAAVNACSEPLTFEVKPQCADGHTWNAGTVTTEPTEETEGVRTYTCTVCGETRTESIAALPHITHRYVATVTPPTCTEQGYTVYFCRCGHGYTDDYVDPLGHTWGEGIVQLEPTEEEHGLMVYYCQICHDIKGEVIPQLPHTHDYTTSATPPTCTERGYTTYTCECGETYNDSYIDPLGHNWDSGVVTREPTEDTEGIKTYTCSRCNETRTESIAALPHTTHNYTAIVTPPTCTEQGFTTYTCGCGESYVDNQIEALGHSWNSGVITLQPPEDTEGLKTFTCQSCGATRTETIPVLVPEPTDPPVALPTLTGTYTTDLIMPAADLGVSAPDSVLRATLIFGEDGSASCAWEAVDLTAFRIFFHDMFVNAYYAMAYGAGITDLAEIEQFCMESTGLSVSDYMDTLVTDQAMIESFTPASTSGTYSYNADHSAILTDLAIMDVASDPTVENSFVLGGGTLYLTAASWDKPDYTFVCTAQ